MFVSARESRAAGRWRDTERGVKSEIANPALIADASFAWPEKLDGGLDRRDALTVYATWRIGRPTPPSAPKLSFDDAIARKHAKILASRAFGGRLTSRTPADCAASPQMTTVKLRPFGNHGGRRVAPAARLQRQCALRVTQAREASAGGDERVRADVCDLRSRRMFFDGKADGVASVAAAPLGNATQHACSREDHAQVRGR